VYHSLIFQNLLCLKPLGLIYVKLYFYLFKRFQVMKFSLAKTSKPAFIDICLAFYQVEAIYRLSMCQVAQSVLHFLPFLQVVSLCKTLILTLFLQKLALVFSLRWVNHLLLHQNLLNHDLQNEVFQLFHHLIILLQGHHHHLTFRLFLKNRQYHSTLFLHESTWFLYLNPLVQTFVFIYAFVVLL